MPRKQETKFLLRRGDTWYYNRNGARISLKTSDLATARAERDKLMEADSLKSEADRAEHLSRLAVRHQTAATGLTPLAEVFDKFPPKRRGKSKKKLNARTVADYRQIWEKLVRFMAERYPKVETIGAVTAEHIAAFDEYLVGAEKLSAARHNRILLIAGKMFRRVGHPEPFANITERDDHTVREHEELTPEQISAVLDKAAAEAPDLHRLLLVAAYTGLRLGDCCTLAWSDIDMARGKLIRKTAKTGAEIAIPLLPELAAELAKTPANKRKGMVSPELAEQYTRNASTVTRRVKAIFDAADIATQDEIDGRTRAASVRGVHSFRVFFATTCAESGKVPISDAMAWLGHHSEAVHRGYQRAGKDEGMQRIADVVVKRLARKPEEQLLAKLRQAAPDATEDQLAAALAALGGAE